MSDSNDPTGKPGDNESAGREIDPTMSSGAVPDAESDAASAATFSQQPVKQVSRGGVVAWLALLLSACALFGFGYQWLTSEAANPVDDRTTAELASLSNTLRATRDALDTLEQSVSSLSALEGTRAAEAARLQRQLEDRMQQMASLPGRVRSIEGTITSLQGVSTGARNAWLLAEAEYYLQIANAQLQLAGNPHLATLALTLADERLLQLADPGLVDVRRALSNELRALEAMEKPDTEGITLALASLAAAVDALPLREELELEADRGASLDPELTGVDRAMASLKGAFGKVVSVRRTEESLKPLLAPEARYFLRTNLALQFQAARLAVLRNEEAIFGQSIDTAAAWLAEYYDTNSNAVQNAQQTLADIRDSTFTVAVPDISESLRLLRQFVNFSAVAAESATADRDAAAEAMPAAQPEPEPASEAESETDALPEPETDANEEPGQ